MNLTRTNYSHHPPVTAYSIKNKAHGVHLQGYNAQKASFSRRIDVRQIGHAELYLEKYDEHYLITLPSLHIEGLITGSPFVELNRSTMIQSSTGYTAKIDYSGRGWVSGKKNSFTATMYLEGKEKDTLYSVEGQWTGEFTIKDAKTKKVIDTWKANEHARTPLQVAPPDQQDELESRRAWKRVADNIAKGDMNVVAAEKTQIENTQRELRKKEKAENREWDRIFFSRLNKSDVFEKLARKIGESLEPEKTNGLWRFDEQKAANAKQPYREGTMPRGKAPMGLSRSNSGGSVRTNASTT